MLVRLVATCGGLGACCGVCCGVPLGARSG